jgi:hypothetical protein
MNQPPQSLLSLKHAASVRSHVSFRRITATAAVLGFAVIGLVPVSAQKSYWVGPQTGSNIAPGFVRYGNNAPTTVQSATEDPALASAITSLESRAGTLIDGRPIVWDIVSQEVRVPVPTLKQQAADTKMSAGELLVANSIAGGSGKRVGEVVALRRKSKSWAEVSRQLKVDPKSVATRARSASESLRAAQTRIARGRERTNSRMLQGGSLAVPEAGSGGGSN